MYTLCKLPLLNGECANNTNKQAEYNVVYPLCLILLKQSGNY